MAEYNLVIDGELVEGTGAINVINPATEETFATVARATEKEAEAAVQAAKTAFVKWSETPLKERQKLLTELANAVSENAERLARLLTQEQGKPLAEAMGEMAWTEGYLRHFSTLEIENKIIQDDDDFFIELRRKPLGVVAESCPGISPCLSHAGKSRRRSSPATRSF